MIGWTIADWRQAALEARSPRDLLVEVIDRLPDTDPAWITLANQPFLDRQLARLEQLAGQAGCAEKLALFGVPFAVKDNIDVAGFPTTAACPDFAYTPERSAGIVERLQLAGAIAIGKTNLDQFATGLVGSRSPYGVVRNCFDSRYISGGSSAGSAAVVASGQVPFALGTDTAGSGRVPAGLNNIVGLKPTRGRLGTSGLVPACRTLDCVSVLALTVDDARYVCQIGTAVDPADPYSRKVPEPLPVEAFGPAAHYAIPSTPEFFGDRENAAAWANALQTLEARGVQLEPRELSVLDEVAVLLYQGPWLAERYAAIESFITRQPGSVHEVIRDIILEGKKYSAVDAFRAQYQLAALKRLADAAIAGCDALVVPTVPCHLLVDDVLADPVRLNSRLGKYTNFVNLLDWCALSIPAGMRADGLPFGITLIAPQWCEQALCTEGRLWQYWLSSRLGATNLPVPEPPKGVSRASRPGDTDGTVRLAVVGAHLSGMPLNHQLTGRGGRLVSTTTTAPRYRLFALPDASPPKPALSRTAGGAGIEIEVWELPLTAFGSFVAEVPWPLGIGSVELADGTWIKGFISESDALASARDITSFGGWRAYLADRANQSAS